MEHLIKNGYYDNGRYMIVTDYDNNQFFLFHLDLRCRNTDSIRACSLKYVWETRENGFKYNFGNRPFLFDFYKEFSQEDLLRIKQEITLFNNKERILSELKDKNIKDGEYFTGLWFSPSFIVLTHQDKKIVLREEEPKIILYDQIKIEIGKYDSDESFYGYIMDADGSLIKSYRFSHIATIKKLIGFKPMTEQEKEQIINEIMNSEEPSHQKVKKRLAG